ncbi:TipAS antibiotic-recognition domain-containing protein [Tersicoccus sp. Bi-70]|uniref:MerR family transcriptional regulator n=1 Tax=Tersicoccus sp. Bi-70 TaxID=1897634 RepID=UPI0009767690|nr:TipAS antibiotic-recognition domain-containing protein [Tersicoccus sp. Bi-70]OMH34511.1 MerR family transcriptional regulator [Tersicoccus sp. Bi-70]
MEWSIHQLARLAGTTSRTLRHYGDVGLLEPSRVGANGYRYYDQTGLLTLQRILLLRQLGLGLPRIREVMARQTDPDEALAGHLRWLRLEQQRLDDQITAVQATLQRLAEGEGLMAEESLHGFDHTQYRQEVVERWGQEAYRSSDAWWRGKSEKERTDWQQASERLQRDWADAAAAGEDPDGEIARALAARQATWLASIPGTPGACTGAPDAGYLRGLAEMYVADERFAANYGGVENATFVRDALLRYADGLDGA